MVGIYARNMPEWTQADPASLAARGVSVPIYPTSTLDQCATSSRMPASGCCSWGTAPVRSGAAAHRQRRDPPYRRPGRHRRSAAARAASHFQTFLVSGNHPPSELELRERECHYRMDDLLTLIHTRHHGRTQRGSCSTSPTWPPASRCMTAASTWKRTGRVPLHAAAEPRVRARLSYYVLYCGAENVYIRDPQKVMDVIGEVKPTVMCAVPRLYEKAYAMIQAKVAQAPPLRRALFGWATRVGRQMVAARQAGKSASPALRPALACRAPGVSQAARPVRRPYPLPAGGGRSPCGRGEPLLPGHGAQPQVRLRHDREPPPPSAATKTPGSGWAQSARRSAASR